MKNFYKKALIATAVAASAFALSACDHKISMPVGGVTQSGAISKDSSFEDKAAYAIGASLGEYVSQMKKNQENFIGQLNSEMIVAGFQDGVNGASMLGRDEIEDVLKDLDKRIQEKVEVETKKAAEDNLKVGEDFLKANASKEGVVTTASGLQYKVITKGEGAMPKKGDTISVIYKGTLIDGTVFDEQKAPVEFPLDNMIPGWIEGLQLMTVGSEYELYIPSKLGYGENAVGNIIKPNSVLIFNVKLTAVKEAKKEAEQKK